MRDWTNYDQVGAIIDYESGGLSDEEMVQLFQNLVDTGTIHHLQGHYGRVATELLNAGLVSRDTNRAPTKTLADL